MRLFKIKPLILTFLILSIISLHPSTIMAQTVAVTGTITDTQTTPYSNGLLTVTFVNATGQLATFGGNPSFQKSYAIYLDSNGAFTISLPPNSTASPSIQPAGTQWNFSYQSQGGYGAANINVTITGAGSISGTLSNLARITWPYGNIPPPGASGQGIVFVSSTTLGWGTTGTAGAVTHTAGNLTLNSMILGNGVADAKVDTACVTNGTGALSGCTSISAGSGASAAGATATGGFACVEAGNTGWTPTAGQTYIRCDATLNNYAVSIPLNGATETPLPVFSAVPAGGKCAQTSGVAGLLAETANPCGTATVLATGTNPPACAVATSAWCGGGSVPPTPVADVYDLHPDSTQKAFEVNNNNTGEMPVSRVSCLNVTPVTINTSTTADQNLMACTLSTNLLNVVGRILKIYGAGVYSTAATSTAQLAMEAKLCTVSGCGSGTVVDICDITTIALASVTVTNNTWAFECIPITQTAGASSVYEHSGRYTIDLGSLTSAADSVFLDPTATAVSSAIDSTAQLFLQISGAFSAASASNTMTERQLFVEVLN